MAVPRFGIANLVNDIGEAITIVKITVSSTNTRGDETTTTTDYATTGVVQVMTAEDLEVQEGILKPEDIIAYFDDSNSYVSYLVIGNNLTWSSKSYEIKEVIINQGHYEVHGSKL